MPQQRDLRSVHHPDGAVLLDVELGLLTTLNPIGSLVWQRLKSGDSVETIVAFICAETGAEIEIVTGDVHEFLASLTEHGLLEKAGSRP